MKRIERKTMYLSNGELRERVIRSLLAEASNARSGAYAPYSEYYVGAALLTTDGHIYTGSNIENASYGATLCAERVALAKAVSEGVRSFLAIAVVGGQIELPTPQQEAIVKANEEDNLKVDKIAFCPPCGICRQALAEFCDPDHFFVIVGDADDEYEIFTLDQLLPQSFSRANLNK